MKFSNPALTHLALAGCLLGGVRVASAACLKSSLMYTNAEANRKVVTKFNEYVYCRDTTITIGGESGITPGIKEPPIIVFNPKIRFKCGETGKRSEKCVIKGNDMMSSLSFAYWSESGISENWPPAMGSAPNRTDYDPTEIEFHGFTFDGGSMFAESNVPAGVTFKDCAFINGDAKQGPAFQLSNVAPPPPTEAPVAAPVTMAPVTMAPVTMAPATMAPSAMPNDETSVPTGTPTTAMPTGVPTTTTSPVAAPVTASPTVSPSPVTASPINPGNGQCNINQPCTDSKCCSTSNFCGVTPQYCAPENCLPGAGVCWNATQPPVVTAAPTAAPVVASTAAPVASGGNETVTDAPTDAPVASPVGGGNETATLAPVASPVGGGNETGTDAPAAAPVVGDNGTETDTMPTRRLAGRRAADGDMAFFTFEMCDFEGNEIAHVDEVGAFFMHTVGADVTFDMCRFDDNKFVVPGSGNGTAMAALFYGDDSKLSITESCVTKTANVVALFAVSAETTLENDKNYASATTPANACDGIHVMEGAGMNSTCEAFDAKECMIVVPTMKPSKAPSPDDTKEPTQAPSMSTAPTEGTPPPNAAPVGACVSSSLVVAALSALFVVFV